MGDQSLVSNDSASARRLMDRRVRYFSSLLGLSGWPAYPGHALPSFQRGRVSAGNAALRREGVIKAVDAIVQRKAESAGYTLLAEMGLATSV